MSYFTKFFLKNNSKKKAKFIGKEYFFFIKIIFNLAMFLVVQE